MRNQKAKTRPQARLRRIQLNEFGLFRSEGWGVSGRNCWRGARSVSPDISPRPKAFVPTSMRRSESGLSKNFLSLEELAKADRSNA
jgi:hypothetical protein